MKHDPVVLVPYGSSFEVRVGPKITGSFPNRELAETARAATETAFRRDYWGDVGVAVEGYSYVVQTYFPGLCAVYAGLMMEEWLGRVTGADASRLDMSCEAEHRPLGFIDVSTEELDSFDAYRNAYAQYKTHNHPTVKVSIERWERAETSLRKKILEAIPDAARSTKRERKIDSIVPIKRICEIQIPQRWLSGELQWHMQRDPIHDREELSCVDCCLELQGNLTQSGNRIHFVAMKTKSEIVTFWDYRAHMLFEDALAEIGVYLETKDNSSTIPQ